jgi:hypothetical protein
MITYSPLPEKLESMKAFAVFLHLEFGAGFNSTAKYLNIGAIRCDWLEIELSQET